MSKEADEQSAHYLMQQGAIAVIKLSTLGDRMDAFGKVVMCQLKTAREAAVGNFGRR
jgi:hypothetical protein